MRSLFWKGMLAFLAVILVAVGTVSLLTSRITETEFRRYAIMHGGMGQHWATVLASYYAAHGSWEGVQNALPPGRGRGAGGMMGMAGFHFQVADAEGRVVGDTDAPPDGTVSQSDLAAAIPIEVEGQVVGYLLTTSSSWKNTPLDAGQAQFLSRVRSALWTAALAATAVALVIGGLLFRSIVAPLRHLTAASRAIAAGDLSVRAPVQGGDEVAQLADAFNQMAESLARAEQARRNQTADVAHELRTPLTVIQGTLEAMLDGVYPADRDNLQAALAQTRTLSRLVEDLRLLALADAGRLSLHTAPLDLASFLRETVEAHQTQAQERDVSLALEIPAPLPPVEADRDRLAQVLGNLLNNALRYVPSGGHVTIRARGTEEEVAVSVSDDGPGIPPADLPHLFERFWRGDRARRQATGGSGLGLTIARSLVEAHGGRLWVESAAGKGAVFTFTLPVGQRAD